MYTGGVIKSQNLRQALTTERKSKIRRNGIERKPVVGGSFVLDMTSINATDLSGEYQQKLNGHLKNGDFFEVEKYPTATFKITGVKKNNDKVYTSLVTGNLTVKGKTNAISFPAKLHTQTEQ
jgi:polyisoprenoid-binding protein YceI